MHFRTPREKRTSGIFAIACIIRLFHRGIALGLDRSTNFSNRPSRPLINSDISGNRKAIRRARSPYHRQAFHKLARILSLHCDYATAACSKASQTCFSGSNGGGPISGAATLSQKCPGGHLNQFLHGSKGASPVNKSVKPLRNVIGISLLPLNFLEIVRGRVG